MLLFLLNRFQRVYNDLSYFIIMYLLQITSINTKSGLQITNTKRSMPGGKIEENNLITAKIVFVKQLCVCMGSAIEHVSRSSCF